MARKPRLHVPGGVYHVMLRGNGGQEIFFDEEDRYHLYLLMQEGIERFGHRIHGFCCMPNHLHLVVQVAREPLSRIMQNLGFRYTRWVNKKQSRTGHLFQGRYKAVLVDADSYLLELVRYIHLNPVRAGLVKDPVEYPWSSHRAYLGLEELPWVQTESVLSQFAKRLVTCRKRYAIFIQKGITEGHREEFHQGGEDSRVLGDDDYLNRVLGIEPSSPSPVKLRDIVAHVAADMGVTQKKLKEAGRDRVAAKARAAIGYLARRLDVASLTEVAAFFQRDLSTLSRQVGELEKKVASQRDVRRQMNRYVNKITQA